MMTSDGQTRRCPALLLGVVAFFAVAPAVATAQTVDCADLRARIDALGRDGATGQFDGVLRQQRDEIARARAYADQSGCSGNDVFDDPDSAQCRALARRIGTLEAGLQRLEDQASRGDPAADDRRQALTAEFDSACSADSAESEPPPTTMPVDPGDTPAPASATPAKSAHVFCVRQCDGAYYPLAVDVAADRMDDMNRICQAQCPAAASSAYATNEPEDVSGALASDGTRYSALPAAFRFRNGTTAACACRAPHQSWAEALAGAEAVLEPHKGDVTVTAALSAAMARPTPAPARVPKSGAAEPRKAARTPAPALALPAPAVPQPPDPARNLMRELRRSVPTP